MEKINEKCSFIEHNQLDAFYYCKECKVYMCNKCSTHHKGLCKNHQQLNLSKDYEYIYIDICKEENHNLQFEYYCKNHNILCCGLCIAKLKGKGKGQHKDCEIIFLEDIKEEKKNKLKKNILYLEELSKELDNYIKELKNIFDKINNKKEELKLNIQKIFTKLRNALNEREEKLLSEVDNKYNNIFCDENIIKDGEKLPEKIKISLEKAESINNEWNDTNKLGQIVYECINIENNINQLKIINKNIKKCSSNKDKDIKFYYYKQIDDFILNINNFGDISEKNNLLEVDTSILRNKDDLKKFYDLLPNNIKINEIKLLYRATKDGLNFQNIVDKINNKSNLIFLYCTGNTRIFGTFIKTKLENIEHHKSFKDENAFVFSLNNKKIYKILNPENAIMFYNDNNIIGIGNSRQWNGFYFESKTINDKGLLNEPKIYEFQKNNELTGTLNSFIELEIFEING